jgi:hypothetical protein
VEFFRDIDTYMYYGGHFYKLHVQNVSFSQSFKQKGTKQKTIHTPTNLIEGSEINEANPAQFELELLMVDESSRYQHYPLQVLLSNTNDTLTTFDLYVDPSVAGDASRKMYKLTTCVLESGSFTINKGELMVVSLSGTASKLTRENYTAFDIGSFITISNTTYAIPKSVNVTVAGTVLDSVTGISLEIQNKIKWRENNILQNSLTAVTATSSTYPTSFSLTGREVAGNITTYVGPQVSDIQTWKENIAIRIQAGLASNNYQLDAQLTPCSFTNRVQPTEAFTQGYDFRMIGSPTNLNTLFTY